MRGDFSRFTFDVRRNYAAVRQQQGRVSLDSDWNEQADLLDRRLRAAMVDMFGRVFFAGPDAFKIAVSGKDLSIGRGRVYLDGLVAENHGSGPLAWDPVLAEEYGQSPVAYTAQPYLPGPPPLPASGGPYLVYLDVWQRDVSAVEDSSLTDVALGGADTATRTQTIWQVKLLPKARATLESAADPAPSTGRCSVEATPSYKGVENQLYRIDVHGGGAAGQATFKWSRDNGSVAARVVQVNSSSQITIDAAKAEHFANGDWIEITDDHLELHGRSGEMRRVARMERGLVTLAAPMKRSPDLTANARIRRWDQKGKVTDAAGTVYADLDKPEATGVIALPADGRPLMIEAGITVRFSAGAARYRAGDHWVTPARAANASIAPLRDAPPRGIHHHYAELALYTPPKGIKDRRKPKP